MQATVKKYGFITLCCIPFALAFDCFYAPNGLTCGGFTGVAQIINHFLPFAPVGTVAFLLNLPLFILGLVRHGKGFLLSLASAPWCLLCSGCPSLRWAMPLCCAAPWRRSG